MADAQVLHFFGGKGGTGKTTLATAYALNYSEANPKEKVLLASLEPVGALGDLIRKKLSAKPARLLPGKGDGGLFAAELEPKAALEVLAAELKPALRATVQKGSLLSQDDLASVLEQALPGLDDLAVLFQLQDWLEAKSFDRVVIDGTAAAPTLRLVDLPTMFRRYLAICRGERVARAAKPGKPVKAEPEAAGPLDALVAKTERLQALLRDPTRMAFHLTALPEPVPEAQTRQLFAGLRERSVPVVEIVVNQVEDREGCPACQGRRGLQAPHVRKYQALDPKGVKVELVAKREQAPRGLDMVKKLAKEWATGKETTALAFAAAEGPPALVRAPSMPPIAAPPLPPTRLILFVGQGGVGKSSCAAAAAVTLTEKEGPVLLISTDPVHSLSDVLLSRLTDTETQVKGTKGLYARELDIPNWFANLKRKLRERAEVAFGPELKGQDVPVDREALRNLIDVAPFSIEELAAMSALADALIQERFKRIVVDPIPAGSAVRLIELPEILRNWLSAVHAVLVKYRTKGLGQLADEIAAMLKHVQRFENALATPAESRFVVVTRGEELAMARSDRLVEYLKGKKMSVERVLVNRVLPKSTCERCESRRQRELGNAKVIEKKIGLQVTVAPALGRHPSGLRELKAFRTSWYALSATAVKTKAASAA